MVDVPFLRRVRRVGHWNGSPNNRITKGQAMTNMKATCIITNCRNRVPAGDPFCAKHKDKEPIMTDAIHPAPAEFSQQLIDVDPILRYFHYTHLPATLQAASRQFCELAAHIVTTLPRNAERTVALRKLLEAKDAAVRANVP